MSLSIHFPPYLAKRLESVGVSSIDHVAEIFILRKAKYFPLIGERSRTQIMASLESHYLTGLSEEIREKIHYHIRDAVRRCENQKSEDQQETQAHYFQQKEINNRMEIQLGARNYAMNQIEFLLGLDHNFIPKGDPTVERLVRIEAAINALKDRAR